MKRILIIVELTTLAGLTVTLLAAQSPKPCAPMTEADRIIDCRKTGLEVLKDYPPVKGRDGFTWSTRDIHYNRQNQHCYVSLHGAQYYLNHETGALVVLTEEKVIDVDENRDVLSCLRSEENHKKTEWLCNVDHSPKRITHERFEELQRQYLERDADDVGRVGNRSAPAYGTLVGESRPVSGTLYKWTDKGWERLKDSTADDPLGLFPKLEKTKKAAKP
jgi:hypothetical protein